MKFNELCCNLSIDKPASILRDDLIWNQLAKLIRIALKNLIDMDHISLH